MHIKGYSRLSEEDKKIAAEICTICNEYDGTDYTPIIGEAEAAEADDTDLYDIPLYFMVYDSETDGRAAGYVGAYLYDNRMAELSVFLIPEYRGKHKFYEIFDAVSEQLYENGIDEVVFCIQASCRDKTPALAIMEELEGELNVSECLYELRFETWMSESITGYVQEEKRYFKGATAYKQDDEIRKTPVRDTDRKTPFNCPEVKKNIISPSSEHYTLLNEKGISISEVKVFYDKATVCIYEVETAPEYRRQGYCKRLLEELLLCLKEQGCFERVILQVNAENIPAVKLYETLGFKCISRNDFYIVGL